MKYVVPTALCKASVIIFLPGYRPSGTIILSHAKPETPIGI